MLKIEYNGLYTILFLPEGKEKRSQECLIVDKMKEKSYIFLF